LDPQSFESPACWELDSFGIAFYAPLVHVAERNPTTCKILIQYQLLVPRN